MIQVLVSTLSTEGLIQNAACSFFPPGQAPLPASSDELAGKLLKLCTGQALFDVLGARGIRSDERQRNLGLSN